MADLIAELEGVVRLSERADALSYADEEKAYAYRDATIAALDYINTHRAEIAAAVSRDDILRELVESWRALERISGNKFERGVFKLCADQVVAAMAQEGAG